MKFTILRKFLVVLIILTPCIVDFGCKKQVKCGCGKDVINTLTDGDAYVYYSESGKSAYFYSVYSSGSTYNFCNPGKWMDQIKTLSNNTEGKELLISGPVYYDCQYLMNNSNYGYSVSYPVYWVDVTDIKKNYYGKK